MPELRIAHLPLARVIAALGCAAGLAVAGCGPSGPSGPSASNAGAGLVGASGPLVPPAGPAAAVITRFRWSSLPSSPLGPRSAPLLAWTGGELLELGGLKNGGTSYWAVAFNPATGRWRWIAGTGGRNVGFTNAVSVWTGRQLFVANGQFESCVTLKGGEPTPANCWPQAGLYDPAANRWSSTSLPRPMDSLSLGAAVWTGRDVILAGVSARSGELGVASYNPAVGRWRMITPALPAAHPPRSVAMAATASRVILWSLWDRVKKTSDGFSDYAGIDALALSQDGRWRDVTGGWPQDRLVTSPVFTGAAILISPGQVWCGTVCSGPGGSMPGYFANPATLARKIIPPGPLGMTDPAFIWTGRAIIAVDQYANIGAPGGQGSIRPDDMALWDPVTSRWLPLPAPPGYPELAATPVWAADQLLALTSAGQLLAFRSPGSSGPPA